MILNVLRGLDRARFTPALVMFQSHGPLAHLVPTDVTVHEAGRRRLRGAAPALLQILRALRPEVIVSTFGHVNLALLLMRPLLPDGVRIVIREPNAPSLSLPELRFGGILRRGYRALYPRADRIISPSRAIATELANDFAVPEDKISCVANPIEAAQIREDASRPTRLPGSGQRFIAAGKLTRQKGFDQLLNMFSALPATARLTILGEGRNEASLRFQAGALGIAERVTFAGFVDRPWPMYAGADALLFPSRWEGMPNAPLESLACGTPIIATPQAGGLTEVARETSEGAITLAAAGDEFIDAMKAITPRAEASLRPSLLPPRFLAPSAAAEFGALLLD